MRISILCACVLQLQYPARRVGYAFGVMKLSSPANGLQNNANAAALLCTSVSHVAPSMTTPRLAEGQG